MRITDLQAVGPKTLVVFDLDGTLALTKAPMDAEMTQLMMELLAKKQVAVIGGGKYELFQQQLLAPLASASPDLLKNLSLFPTTSTRYYRYAAGAWEKVYAHELSAEERARITATFERVFAEIGYQHPAKTYGPVIEDRGTQVTWSALGQEVVAELGPKGVELKEDWKAKNTPIKMKVAELMATYLPDLEVRAAGHTSVDVTKKGIDKAYGLQQIERYLGIPMADMLFVGDAIFPGGNDYAVTKTAVDYVAVNGPEETKDCIRFLLNQAV